MIKKRMRIVRKMLFFVIFLSDVWTRINAYHFGGYLLRKHFLRAIVCFVNRGVSLVGSAALMLLLFVPTLNMGLDDASRIIGRAVMTII